MSKVSQVKQNAISPDEFRGSIKASWNKAVSSILETGQTLKTAQDQLQRRDYLALVRQLQDDNVMSKSTISKLIAIASNDVLTAPDNLTRLPASYGTLYEIAQYDGDVVQGALSGGQLSSMTQRRDLKDVLPPRKTRQMKTTRKVDRIRVSVRFSAIAGDVPDDVLAELQAVVKKVEAFTDVKVSGL